MSMSAKMKVTVHVLGSRILLKATTRPITDASTPGGIVLPGGSEKLACGEVVACGDAISPEAAKVMCSGAVAIYTGGDRFRVGGDELISVHVDNVRAVVIPDA